MSLIVPQRRAAESHSFPMDASKASRWLATLQPLHSHADAREVQRGLKHSNRLVASTNERRQLIDCFVPVLTDLYEHLSEQCLAQPLPLTLDFHQAANLLDNLLREEAYAYKILVTEDLQAQGAEIALAMQALCRQVEISVNTYQAISDGVLQDAQQLYAIAERQNLLESTAESLSIENHYLYILLLYLADTYQVRVRQMPLLLAFLQDQLNDLHLLKNAPGSITAATVAVSLGESIRPAAGASLLLHTTGATRWLDLKGLNQQISAKIQSIQINPAPTLGADTLERRTLARLQMAINHNRRRRSARSITHTPMAAVFGHNEICAAMSMAEQHDQRSVESAAESLTESVERTADDLELLFADHAGWTVQNHSAHGLCLSHLHCPPGTVQVGELVGLPGAAHTRLGVVRWMKSGDANGLITGIELLTKSAMSVKVHQDSQPAANEYGLIFACKVHNSVVQTIMLPAYRFRENDLLTVNRQEKSRNLKLGRCLQHNGLFGHFVLASV